MNIYKQEAILAGLSVEYSKWNTVEKDLAKVDERIRKIQWEKLSQKKIIEKISRIIACIWQIHPFREGNTRTVATFLFFFMKGKGIPVDSNFLSENAKFFRNALVLASIGQYSEYNHLESILSDSIKCRSDANKTSSEKYQTIKGYDLSKYKYNYHSSENAH